MVQSIVRERILQRARQDFLTGYVFEFLLRIPRRCALTSCTNTQGMLPEWRIAISGEFASQDNQPSRW